MVFACSFLFMAFTEIIQNLFVYLFVIMGIIPSLYNDSLKLKPEKI